MTVNATLRLPAALAGALDVRAAQAGTNRHQLILDILQAEVGESGLIAGRWQVFGCEIEECADCGQRLEPGNIWLGATADGRMFGPLCGGCAVD